MVLRLAAVVELLCQGEAARLHGAAYGVSLLRGQAQARRVLRVLVVDLVCALPW